MHSTYIKALTEHCAQALAWEVEAKPWISDARLDAGVCAHAILEAAKGRPESAWQGIADAVVKRLCLSGYSFDGKEQPPLNLEEAQEGAGLALRWLRNNGAEPVHALTEIGLAVDVHGVACDYRDGAYRAIIDLVRFDEGGDDEDVYRVLTVADYKTSWQADARELETLQRKGQAVVVAAKCSDWDILLLEVRNLRTGVTHSMEIRNDDEGRSLLEQWSHDVLLAADVAREALKKPAASPGAGCIGCPFAYDCEAVMSAVQADSAPVAWAAAKAVSESLRPIVGKLAKNGPVALPDGGHIAYTQKECNTVTKDAPRCSLDYWEGGELTRDAVVGMLEAMGVGVTQVKNLAKALKKIGGDAAAEDYLSGAMGKKTAAELVIVSKSCGNTE